MNVALVTGANRGIGREIARQLVRDHGFTVLAGARNPGEVVADENLVPLRLDVRDPDSVGAAIAGIEANPGSLDVLVNNAGIYGDPTGAADYDLDEAHDVLETNIFGPWRLIQASLPLLRSSASPRIVNVSSGAGQLAEMDGGHTAYRLSKAALNALTRTLATDEPKISVNSICPGWVRTDMGGSRAPRSVEEGADTAVWLATMADDVPSGGFFRNREPIPW
ncbi:MAG TPA: SDR family oxidoreductase [Solirubrobacterales bacterium]|nr:SDR family oxidoreductase [Solirubrobacterales bacterium]